MSGWWFAAGCFGLYLLFCIYAARRDKRQVIAFAGSRVSPNREQFVELLAADCDADVADFLWEKLAEDYSCWDLELTPHPDDNYLEDMPIDPEHQGDWLDGFCAANDVRAKDFPPWTEGQETTVRNFARWLSSGRRSLVDAAA